MGGPPVSKEIKELIISTWQDMKAKPGEEPAAKEVLSAVTRIMYTQDRRGEQLPKLRKVQAILQETRQSISNISVEDKLQAKSWTMATLDEYPLPPESIPHVLQVWRYCINLDVPFTIRHAKWVSRLYAQVPDTLDLWFESRRYTKEEELSLATGEPMKNFMLDSRLVMDEWEFLTAIDTDVLYPRPPFLIQHTLRPIAQDGGICEEMLNAISNPDPWGKTDEETYYRNGELHWLISNLPSSVNYFPDIESRMVYLRHLSCLAKGNKWNTLPPKEIRDIIVELREWVRERYLKFIQQDIEPDESLFGGIFREKLAFPNELYERVDYEHIKKGGYIL